MIVKPRCACAARESLRYAAVVLCVCVCVCAVLPTAAFYALAEDKCLFGSIIMFSPI